MIQKRVEDIPPEALPFDEAIEYFKSLLPMSDKEFYALADEAKSMAFAVSAVAQEEAIADAYRLVRQALEKGQSLGEFQKEFAKKMAVPDAGLSRDYIETVYRTNLQRAYNVGRFRQMTRPEVLKSRPFWQYDAVNDSRTRPTHRAMDGRVYRADDPVWDTWYPPNGFRCRCRVNTLSQRQVDKLGVEVLQGPIKENVKVGDKEEPLEPDKGFEHNPGKAMWGYGQGKDWEDLKGNLPYVDNTKEDIPDTAWKHIDYEPVTKSTSRILQRVNNSPLHMIEIMDPTGTPVVITDRFIDHVTQQQDSRIAYIDLLEDLIPHPTEMYMVVQRSKGSGRIRFRKVLLGAYVISGHEPVRLVLQYTSKGWEGWTFLKTNIRSFRKKRYGVLVFPKK